MRIALIIDDNEDSLDYLYGNLLIVCLLGLSRKKSPENPIFSDESLKTRPCCSYFF